MRAAIVLRHLLCSAFGAHALLDAMHVICVLFPQTLMMVLGPNAVEALGGLYASTLANDGDRIHPVLRRFMAYWVAAMSVPRVAALALQSLSPSVFVFVTVAYTLEALVFEFEGTVGGTVPRIRARIAAAVSLLLGAGAAWLAMGRGYYY